MRLGQKLLTLLLLGAAALGALGSKYPDEEGVLVLGDDNFEQALKDHDILLVEFYAPWCGHCKKLEPEYAKAAGILAKHDPPLYIAKVDATVHKKVAEEQELRGFPTIRLFKGGAVSEYQGDRTAEAISDFIIKKSGPPVVTVASVAEAEAFLTKNPKAGIAFFSSLESASAKNFSDFANKFDSYPFAYTDKADVKSKFKAGKKDVLQFKTEEGSFSHELDWAKGEDEVASWVFGHAVPLLFKYDQNHARELFGGPIKVHLLAFLDEEAKDFGTLSAAVKDGAGKTRTQALNILVPKTEERILGAFDLTAADVPKLVIADLRGGPMKRYVYEEKISKAGIEAFLGKFFKGELKPKLKSEEPLPADWETPVKVIKGKSFKEKVLDSDEDVLLEFYAPWCGHCRQLEPKYEELAKKISGSSVVIAKMDATANEVDHPNVNVMGYPTILFFKKGAKDTPVAYDQAREVNSFISWLSEHASDPSTLPAVGAEEAEPEAEAEAGKEEL